MNGEYYQNPIFPGNISLAKDEDNNIVLIGNILELNTRKRINVYTTFEKSFEGILEHYKDDYLIISDPETGKYYLISIKNISYIEFIEKINY